MLTAVCQHMEFCINFVNILMLGVRKVLLMIEHNNYFLLQMKAVTCFIFVNT